MKRPGPMLKSKNKKTKPPAKDLCRICLSSIIGQRFLINTKGPHNSVTFAQMYLHVSGFPADDDPRSLCWGCAKELTGAYKIMKKVEDKERITNRTLTTFAEDLGPTEFENVVVKVEPVDFSEESETLQTEYEPNLLGYKAPNKNNSGSLIQCVLCYYNTYSKKYYQKHVLFHHRHHKLKCDGCQDAFQFIDDLNEHRKDQHEYTHKYIVNLVSDEPEQTKIVVKQEVFEIPPIKKPDRNRHVETRIRLGIRSVPENKPMSEQCQYLPKNRVCQKTGEKYKERKVNINCPLCSYSGIGKSNFRNHYKTQHNNQELKCDGCDEKFYLFYRLYHHREKEHNFTHDYVVDESLKVPDELRRTVRQGADYPCPQCKLVIKGARNLYKHLRIVHNYIRPKPCYDVICDFCGKLVIKHNLERHIRHLHPEHRDPYICDYCGEKRKSDCAMLRHFQTVHKLAQKPRDNPLALMCKYCPEIFATRHQREAHEVRNHTFDYKFICTICDKKFLKNSHLIDHMKRHAKQKMNKSNISCGKCGEGFTRKNFLTEHLTICKVSG